MDNYKEQTFGECCGKCENVSDKKDGLYSWCKLKDGKLVHLANGICDNFKRKDNYEK